VPGGRPNVGKTLWAIRLAAAAWGFAEATLFFIVPDVLLTWVALRDPRAAFAACLWALAAALAGGALMFGWGDADYESALAALCRVPGINRAMCDSVDLEVRAEGVAATLRGPLTGRPYKIYAVQAAGYGNSLAAFLVVSVPARLMRFAAVTALAVLANRCLRRLSLTTRRWIHAVVWLGFYAVYFWNHRG
jgi:membrane protein YqaA with SNARE-associated domain